MTRKRWIAITAGSIALGLAVTAPGQVTASPTISQPEALFSCSPFKHIDNHAEGDCVVSAGAIRLVAECSFPFPWQGSPWRSGTAHLRTPDCGFTGFVNAHYEAVG